jgi:hypothetical protein
MRRNWGISSGPARPFGDRRWLVPFLASLLVTATIFLAALCGLFSPPYPGGDAALFDLVSLDSWDDARSVESGIKKRVLGNHEADDDDNDNPDDAALNSDASDAEPPRIAYLLEGTKGDSLRMRRTLQAIYHPRNQYILHLDLEAPPRERIDLAMYVKGDPMFSQVGNVRVIAKGNLVTYKGPTMVACTLHSVAILLNEGLEWDWFINLSASDYPLMTQDGQCVLELFSSFIYVRETFLFTWVSRFTRFACCNSVHVFCLITSSMQH